MPAELEPQGYISWIAALLGLSGAGGALKLHTTQSDHSARLKKLEQDRDDHGKKIDTIHERTARLDERTSNIRDDVAEILRIIRGPR